jgi:DNA-binding XRE family transcriptional regulator
MPRILLLLDYRQHINIIRQIWLFMAIKKTYLACMTASPMPLPVSRALKKLGTDLERARLRRNMSQEMLAERIGVSVKTVQRMEQGYSGMAVQHLVRAMHVFGELERLNQLLDSAQDTIGLMLADEKLPRRARPPKLGKDTGAL